MIYKNNLKIILVVIILVAAGILGFFSYKRLVQERQLRNLSRELQDIEFNLQTAPKLPEIIEQKTEKYTEIFPEKEKTIQFLRTLAVESCQEFNRGLQNRAHEAGIAACRQSAADTAEKKAACQGTEEERKAVGGDAGCACSDKENKFYGRDEHGNDTAGTCAVFQGGVYSDGVHGRSSPLYDCLHAGTTGPITFEGKSYTGGCNQVSIGDPGAGDKCSQDLRANCLNGKNPDGTKGSTALEDCAKAREKLVGNVEMGVAGCRADYQRNTNYKDIRNVVSFRGTVKLANVYSKSFKCPINDKALKEAYERGFKSACPK